jgi:hypothetical protein
VRREPEPDEIPPHPNLPEVESPPPEEVLDGVPSTDEVVAHAQPADDVVDEQPSVDEILGRDRGGDTAPPR